MERRPHSGYSGINVRRPAEVVLLVSRLPELRAWLGAARQSRRRARVCLARRMSALGAAAGVRAQRTASVVM